MERKFYYKTDFLITLFTALLIFLIPIFVKYNHSLFVTETGKLKIFGDYVGILSLGLLLQWKYVRQILVFIELLTIYAATFGLLFVGKQFTISYAILLLVLGFVVFLLVSKPVKRYY